MKKPIVMVVLLFSSLVWSQEKGSQAEQAACYKQARQYVIDQASTEWRLTFEQAHYDAKTQTCYVEYDTAMPSGTRLVNVAVADAFEGKVFAQCISSLFPKPDEKLEFCQVKGRHANSRAEFNSLLWDMIPALKPIDAKENDTQAVR